MKSPPSQAASLAATQAFLANRASNGDLSAAAAAAALRSHTTSPVPVGQLQTKRMQRRGSVTSNGTASDRPGLVRRTSSGSMTERTFRDPSPNRASSSHGPYPFDDQAPPMPALPKGIQQANTLTPAQKQAARRAASVEPIQRVSSPPPRRVGGRGLSLDRGPETQKPNDTGLKSGAMSLSTVGEPERPGSRNSVNFSRPMSPQIVSPNSPHSIGRVRSPPPSRSAGNAGLPNGEVERILESIEETAATPVKKKKKVTAKEAAEGSYLAQGTTSGAAQAATLLATPQRQMPSTSSTTSSNSATMPSGMNELPKPKRKKKKASPTETAQAQDANDGFGVAYPSDTESVTSERSSTKERPRSYNTRAAGLLMKQPSVVREDREAEEQEERGPPVKKTNGQVSSNGEKGLTTPANISRVVSKNPQQGKDSSRADTSGTPKRASLDVPGVSRQKSLSPSRSTHFSSQPEYETPDAIKHQPPARSVSPAKSALKYSPSRGQSPFGNLPQAHRAGLGPSEASDTASNVSDDGSRSVRKKKKSARVSFDDDSVIVGRAAGPLPASNSPVIASPQNKSESRSWFDLVREQRQEQSNVGTDQDTAMKPTPALPSFGSVRRDRKEEPTLENSPGATLDTDRSQDTLRSLDTSSDQAMGAIVSRHAASEGKKSISQRAHNDPVPPDVTSVEGSGNHSDDETPLLDNQPSAGTSLPNVDTSKRTRASLSTSEAASTELSSESPSEEQNVSVPSIALQPATPGLEVAGENQKDWLGPPGIVSETTSPSSTQPSSTPPLVSDVTEATPALAGLAEPEPEALAAQHDPGTPHVGGVAAGLRTQIDSHSGDESEDTGDSIYSDAAEEPDDVDGDGFGSINAIIESPAPSPVSAAGQVPPISPSIQKPSSKMMKPSPLARKESELSEPASDEGWDRAQAYWSGLSQERRRQLEHASVPGALDETIIPNKTMRGPQSIKKKKKTPKKTPSPPSASDPVLPPWPDKQYRTDVKKSVKPAESPLKSSLRKTQVENEGETHMRSSMRGGPPLKSASKVRSQEASVQQQPEPRGALQKKIRPMSAVAVVDHNKSQPKPAVGHVRASSAGMPQSSLTPILAQSQKKATAKKPALRRNDSGSSSSFRKERLSNPSSGKYTMKRTMRASSPDAQRASNPPASSSLRTASPAGSTARRPFSSVGPGGSTMRTSMREPIGSSKPAARTSLRAPSIDSNRAKSPSRFGFGKSSKPKSVESKSGSRFSSRFGDSSDEDDRMPARSSRFADSSDEDSTKLTPIRGIPRRIDEGESTDLDDSSIDGAPTPSKPKATDKKPTLDTKPEGLALATGSLRVASGDANSTAMGSGLQAKKAAEKGRKKRSFFGGLSNRKRDDPTKVQTTDTESLATNTNLHERSKTAALSTTGSPASHRFTGSNLSTTDTMAKMERPVIGPRIIPAQNSPKSPKLQRRNTPKTVPKASEKSWPLPQNSGAAVKSADGRPRTSDGPAVANGAERPEIGIRRTTLQGAPPPPAASSVQGKTEKKKRFGMLRKAFGIQN